MRGPSGPVEVDPCHVPHGRSPEYGPPNDSPSVDVQCLVCSCYVLLRHGHCHGLWLCHGHPCDTMWNFNRLHTRPYSCSQWISTASADKATNKPTHENQILLSSHSRLLRKLRDTLTLMVSWSHSSLTSMQGQTQTRQTNKNKTKIHQKVVKTCKQAIHQKVESKHGQSCSKQNTKCWAWTCHDWLGLLRLA